MHSGRCLLSRAATSALSVTLGLVAVSHRAHADAVPIELLARGQNRILIDGVLGDWRRFAELVAVDDRAQVLSGGASWTGSDDASFGFAIAQDEQSLYFAAEVHDDRIVRTREHATGDDALVISLAAPQGARTVGYDVVVYPGEPGSFRGAVRFRGARSGAVPGAQIVEAPLRGGASGFTLEVAIPWRSLPEIRAGIAGLRGRVVYEDDDTMGRAALDTVIGTGPGDAQHAELLPPAAGSAGQTLAQSLEQFRQTHGLVGTTPLLDRNVNLAGDAALERVVVFPHYVFAMGPGIAGGTRYAFVEYPANTREDVLEATLRDLTGDGRPDVIVRARLPAERGLAREVLYVYGAPHGADQLTRLFAHELGRASGPNVVANRATYDGSARIRVTFASNEGFTEANYPRVIEPGVLAPLTAWGPDRAVLYRWNEDAQRFEAERSDPNPNAVARRGEPVAPAGAMPSSPAMVQAPSDAAAVLRLFKRQRGLGDDARPRFAASANVAGDPTAESVQIYGRTLVVYGSRFQNGRSFYSVELPANEDADVLGLSMVDVTDDGRPEAVVRIRRASQVQVRGRPIDLVKEFVVVYSMDDAHRGRVFAAEVSRRVGADAVVNTLRPLASGRSAGLVVDAGRAQGAWNAESYPFHDMPAQGFAPLLLPWEPTRRAIYRWDGTQLARVP